MPVYDQTSTSVTDALGWLIQLSVGSLGTTVAILSVAGLGLAMLQGRLPTRRGAAAIAGCFILFSSHAIAAGLMSFGDGNAVESRGATTAAAPAYVAPIPQPVPYDPYAGASVPTLPQDSARNLTPR